MVDVSRRSVLGAGVSAAGLIALGLEANDAEAAAVSVTVPLRSHYARSLGRLFTATHGSHTYNLRLEHIHDLRHTSAKLRPRSFVLVFEPVPGAHLPGAHLPDTIYVLRSRAVAAHHLFLCAIGTGRGMQAVVNRRA